MWNSKEPFLKEQKKSENSIAKRFRWISLIVLGGLIVSSLTFLADNQIFIKSTFFLGLGIGIWFFVDYEMLRKDRFYLKSLIIALGYLGYGWLVKNYYSNDKIQLVDLGALYPITVLILQRPLRIIYLLILKKEPKVDRVGTFTDMIYTFILFLGIAVLPFIITDYLK